MLEYLKFFPISSSTERECIKLKKITFMIFALLLFTGTAYSDPLIIKRGTEVLIRAAEKIKSNKVSIGQTIRFVVERAVKNENGFTLIERGAFAYGKITRATSAGVVGAKGSLSFSIDSVEAFNGQVIPLTGHQDNEGSSSTGVVVVTAIVMPLALLFRGSNAVIDPRTIYPVYVAETTMLEGDFLGLPQDSALSVQSQQRKARDMEESNSDMLDSYSRKKSLRMRSK